jgi:multiple sugar transport system substrate-binding protein
MERAGDLGEYMRHFSRVYEERNPGITVKNESTTWDDHIKKVPTLVASGTMADLSFQSATVMLPNLAAKGVWLDVEPYGNAEKHDWKQYYKWALDLCRQGPNNKLVALPQGVAPGENVNVFYNKEMLEKVGVKPPNPDGSVDDLTALCVDLRKALPDVWPIQASMGHLAMEGQSRTWKGYLISEDRTKCGFSLPETQAAHQYFYDWIHKYKIMPTAQDMAGNAVQMFRSQKLAIIIQNPANVSPGHKEATGGKFTLADTLWPVKPFGQMGTIPGANATVIYGKTKYPQECWGLLSLLSGFEASKWTALNPPNVTPGAVAAAWNDPEVWTAIPSYKTVALYFSDLEKKGLGMGALPVPANTRGSEWDDIYNNDWAAMAYGDTPYNPQTVADLQRKLQAIMDKPMP